MHKIIIPLAIAGLALTGCAAKTASNPTVTVTETERGIADAPITDKPSQLMQLLATEDLDNVPTSTAVDLAASICAGLESGLPWETVPSRKATSIKP